MRDTALLKLDVKRFDPFKEPYNKVKVEQTNFTLDAVIAYLNVWYKTAIIDVVILEDTPVVLTDEAQKSAARYFILKNIETGEFHFSIFTHANVFKPTHIWLKKGRYHIIDTFLYKNFREYVTINPDDVKINATINNVFTSELSKGGFIDDNFNLMFKIKEDNSALNVWKISSYANLINIALVEYINQGEVASVVEMDKEYMGKVKALAFAYPKYNVQDIADELKVSVKSLSYYYKKEMGQTLNKMILESRLNFSKMRLSSSDDTISEIAYQCGYEEIQSFTRFFKNASGQTPSDYRENHKMD